MGKAKSFPRSAVATWLTSRRRSSKAFLQPAHVLWRECLENHDLSPMYRRPVPGRLKADMVLYQLDLKKASTEFTSQLGIEGSFIGHVK